MKNKKFVIYLTILISLLCIYYLSFTFVSRNIQNRISEDILNAETDSTSIPKTKQAYMDSIWNEPVYNFLGMPFTYKEVKETELNLGLDLQGGMHVTLEVDASEIIKGLSRNNTNPAFNTSLAQAKNNIKGTQLNYVDEFYRVFKEKSPNSSLAPLFSSVANRERISSNSTDEEILTLIKEEVDNAIERSFNIIRTRIDRFGTSQPNIQLIKGSGRIQVELPGVDNPQRVRKLIQGVAKLEFWELYSQEELYPVITSINKLLVQSLEKDTLNTNNLESLTTDSYSSNELSSLLTEDATTNNSDTNLTENNDDSLTINADTNNGTQTDTHSDSLLNVSQSPLITLLVEDPRYEDGLLYRTKDTAQIKRIFDRDDVRSLIPRNMKFRWDAFPKDGYESELEVMELYPIKTTRSAKASLSGEAITNATAFLNEKALPEVSMQMSASGARIWSKMTRNNIGNRIAIVLDNYIFSAPVVKGEISNGNSSISGGFKNIDEAKDLANILKAGSLPAPTTIVEDVEVGPTLGKLARRQGITSISVGLIIVLIFMVAYYSKGGLIANGALFLNVFFIMGILANLGTSLTLPGIAGIVLTIGMAIDANVLIFERIKEELRNGTSIKAAISSGYHKAYGSIFDANATTLLVGIILFFFGQGPIKGFAITLMVGIACSFFSAIFITRVIVETLSSKKNKSKIAFANAISRKLLTNLNINFLAKRKWAYYFSIIFILSGIATLIINGIQLGVDFKGGRSYVVAFNKNIEPTQLRINLASYFDNQTPEVKTFGAENILKITTNYLVDDQTDEADQKVRENVIEGLSQAIGLTYVTDGTSLTENNFTITSSSKVGATIADDIKNAAYKSAIIALICIFIYIVFRFKKWQYGLGAIVALFHDTLFVLSAFAFANLLGIPFEADQVFVAAILTIIGYSINDTVVVFDRIRENISLKTGSDLVDTFNQALNNTISRTFITSLTTLIVVIVLLLFGGAVLQGFSFALLVGIIAGTYSSIFIATPIVLDMGRFKDKIIKKI